MLTHANTILLCQDYGFVLLNMLHLLVHLLCLSDAISLLSMLGIRVWMSMLLISRSSTSLCD